MIPESYYVNVNIAYTQPTVLESNVPLSVLVSKTATSSKEYTSLQQVQSDYTLGTEPEVLAAQIYFNNGGTDLLIYQQSSSASDTDTLNALFTAVQNNTYRDFVWLTFAEDKTAEELQSIVSSLENAPTQLPKFLAQTSNVENAPSVLTGASLKNAALLYSSEVSVSAPYSAICISAYFSGINLNTNNSLKSIQHTLISGVTTSNITTAQLTSLYESNWNAIVNLGDRYTIFDGGKMINGEPIHSSWGFAVFKRDCENSITDLLITKLPYDNSSNAVIENTLSTICARYVSNGLIGAGKTYNQNTVVVTYGTNNYTVITNGQVLNNGYYIYSIPIGTAIASDKAINKTPPIYIYAIINDVIRMVEINGEVSK